MTGSLPWAKECLCFIIIFYSTTDQDKLPPPSWVQTSPGLCEHDMMTS